MDTEAAYYPVKTYNLPRLSKFNNLNLETRTHGRVGRNIHRHECMCVTALSLMALCVTALSVTAHWDDFRNKAWVSG